MMRYGNMHPILLDFGDSSVPFMEGPDSTHPAYQKRWQYYLRFRRSAKYRQVWPLRSLSETLVMLPSFLALGKVQTSLSFALA